MKYSERDRAILVDGQPVARIEVLSGDLNGAKVADLISAANRGIGRQGPKAAQAIPGLVNDIDEAGAGGFLAAHHTPWRSTVWPCISYSMWRQSTSEPSARSWNRHLPSLESGSGRRSGGAK